MVQASARVRSRSAPTRPADGKPSGLRLRRFSAAASLVRSRESPVDLARHGLTDAGLLPYVGTPGVSGCTGVPEG